MQGKARLVTSCVDICLFHSLTMTHVGRPGLEELAKVLEVNKTLEVLRFVSECVNCAILLRFSTHD